jgi:hypothetical protein
MGKGAILAGLLIIGLIVLLIVFLIYPAFTIAVLAILVGGGIIIAVPGAPGYVIGGILVVGGLVLAIVASLSAPLQLALAHVV